MGTVILMRRLTIIMLFAAIFAFTFSAVVVYSGGGGMQSRLGARYTCLQANGAYCMIGPMALLRS
jgi:hypothetical protein